MRNTIATAMILLIIVVCLDGYAMGRSETPSPQVVSEPVAEQIIKQAEPPKVADIDVDYSMLAKRAAQYGPILLQELEEYWGQDVTWPSIFFAQVDQETCASQTSAKCWSPTARLKTSREEGYGLGQITRAWDARGNLRFDSLTELRNRHSEALAGWNWKNVADATFQLRGLVLMDRDLYNAFDFAETELDRFAFMDASYNGGQGGLLSDRALCKAVASCNPNVWQGNVELYSKKAKTAAGGYGQGFFQVNRGHVQQVVYGISEGKTNTRRARYQKAGLP